MLSPISIEFASLFHSKKTIVDFMSNTAPTPHQDVLRQSRLSNMVIMQRPSRFASQTEYRLYDSMSNSYFDCVVRDEIDHTGAVTSRYISFTAVFHNDYEIVREFDYSDALSVLPLLVLFEDKVAKGYYEKHKDYLPMIEAMTVPTKNFFVTNLKAILKGAAISEHFKERIQKEQQDHDNSSSMAHYSLGTLKTFLDYSHHRVPDVTSASDLLYNMFEGITGFSYEVFAKKDRKVLENNLNAINQSADEGVVFITEQDHHEFMNPATVDFNYHEFIKIRVNDKIEKMCPDLSPEALVRLKNKLAVNLNSYANSVCSYVACTQAEKFTPNIATMMDRLARNSIFKDYNRDDKQQTPRTIHNAFYESGLYNYLMS